MFAGTLKIFARYWSAYGGLYAVSRSFYLYLALGLLALTFKTWISPTYSVISGSWSAWWDQSFGVLPNLLGFTLGGFAIFIGFGDERFRSQLNTPEDERSQPTIYIKLCSTFVHFILVQVAALMCAIVAKSTWFYVEWNAHIQIALPLANAIFGAIGYGLFLYAITSILAATMHVFRIASMYAAFQKNELINQQKIGLEHHYLKAKFRLLQRHARLNKCSTKVKKRRST